MVCEVYSNVALRVFGLHDKIHYVRFHLIWNLIENYIFHQHILEKWFSTLGVRPTGWQSDFKGAFDF